METGDGLIARVRASGGRLSPRSGRRDRRRRARLRQWRDRAFGARQPADPRRHATAPCSNCTRGSATPASSTPTPMSSGCATSSRALSSDLDPDAVSRSRASRRRARTAPCDEDRSFAGCRRNSASSSTRGGRLPLADVDGGHPLRGPARRGRPVFAVLSRATTPCRPFARRATSPRPRRGSGAPFWRWPAIRRRRPPADAGARRARRRACGLRRGWT